MSVVAAVDVGSNAIRLTIVEVSAAGVLIERINKRYALRLGPSVFAQGSIDDERVGELIHVFQDIATRLRQSKVERYRVVATSAMRDASNSVSTVAAIKRDTGIEVEVISGAEEGCLIRETLARALGTLDQRSLLVDLGGGSVEIERLSAPSGLSLPLGSLRLLDRYRELQMPLCGDAFDDIEDRIRRDLCQRLGAYESAHTAVGTGGNLAALAHLVAVVPSALPAIDTNRLRPFVRELAAMSHDKRAARFDLRADRADVIVPAGLLIVAMIDVFGLSRFLVPGTGIREAIVHRLMVASARCSGGEALARRLDCEHGEAAARVQLARGLFDALSTLHRLWPQARVALEAAAYVLPSATGQTTDAIAGAVAALRFSPGLGLSPVAAALASRAMGCAYDVTAPAGELTAAECEAAEILGAILRLVDTLRREGVQGVPSVDLAQEPVRVTTSKVCDVPDAVLTELQRVLARRFSFA